MPRDLIPVRCNRCATPATVTRTLWQRTQGHLACGKCRRATPWSIR